MSGKIRVLVVDDSSFMRSMLKRMIEKDARFEVVDTAENGQDGVEKTQRLKPDVVTMDVEMPVMTGLDALSEIMRVCPTPVVMVSTLTEQGAKVTLEALEKGAVDFLPKALKDTDRNVLRSGDALYEKLVAASQAHVASTTPARPITRDVTPSNPVAAKPLPSDGTKLAQTTIVVVGSSTGGPKALNELITGLPESLHVPIVIAQHMPMEFTHALAVRLDGLSALTVKEAEHGEVLHPGTVYIAPGGQHTRVQSSEGRFVLDIQPDKGESLYKPSVDVLAESVHNLVGSNVLAVMLTGMGNDGAKAFTKLKNDGAHVIAQDEASSVVYGMPRAVVEMSGATEVLALDSIASRIAQLLS